MRGCHAAACRRLSAWSAARRYDLCSSSIACFGVVELKRGAWCACELVGVGSLAWAAAVNLGAARAAPRPAPTQPARHILRVAVDYVFLGSDLDETGAISEVSSSRRACEVRAAVCVF